MHGKWIKRELERTGGSQVELAAAMGIDPVKLSKSLSGIRRFQFDELNRASRFLGAPLPSAASDQPLISSYDPDVPDPIEEALEQGEGVDVRKLWGPEAIPELLAQGGLGSGQVITSVNAGEMNTVDQVKSDYWRIPNEFARGVLGTAPIYLLVVECSGDSMAPTLQSGDRVWVNTLHKLPSPDGLYAIRDVFDQIVVKRVEVAQAVPLRLRIISDNPSHNAREVGHEEAKIIGKVVAGLKLF